MVQEPHAMWSVSFTQPPVAENGLPLTGKEPSGMDHVGSVIDLQDISSANGPPSGPTSVANDQMYGWDSPKKLMIKEDVLAVSQDLNSGKSFECKNCKKAFTEDSVLDAHQKSCLGEKLYKCKRCQSQFNQLCDFLSHQRSHLATKTHTCQVCKKSFSLLSTLLYHQISHNDSK